MDDLFHRSPLSQSLVEPDLHHSYDCTSTNNHGAQSERQHKRTYIPDKYFNLWNHSNLRYYGDIDYAAKYINSYYHTDSERGVSATASGPVAAGHPPSSGALGPNTEGVNSYLNLQRSPNSNSKGIQHLQHSHDCTSTNIPCAQSVGQPKNTYTQVKYNIYNIHSNGNHYYNDHYNIDSCNEPVQGNLIDSNDYNCKDAANHPFNNHSYGTSDPNRTAFWAKGDINSSDKHRQRHHTNRDHFVRHTRTQPRRRGGKKHI